MADNAKCRECIYGTTLGRARNMVGCYYMNRTGHRRPCPAGEKCTVFIPREGKFNNREQFFADDAVTYGRCEGWHKEEEK